MSRNDIVKHFMAIGSGAVVVLLINVFTVPLITRLVDPSEYGVQSVFSMYAVLASNILYLGQDQALLRYFYTNDCEEYKRTLLYRCVKYPLFLCILASVALILLKMCGIAVIELEFWTVGCLCVYTAVLVIDRFASMLLRLTFNARMCSLIGIASRLAYLFISVGMIVLMKGHHSGILIIATTFSASLGMVMNMTVGWRYWSFVKKHDYCECVSMTDILWYGMPFVLSSGITAFFGFIDKMTIRVLGSYADVGIYSSAIVLANLFSIISTTFCTIWSPLAIENYEKRPEDRSLYINGHNIITVIAFFAGLTLILLKDVLVVFLGEKYREAACLLPFLLFNPIMVTVSETTVLGLYFERKSKLQIMPSLVACMTNLMGNFIFVPMIGIKGAAISTGCSYIIFFVVRTILGMRCYYIQLNLKAFFLISSLLLIYAFYNTFSKFNAFTVVAYLLCIFFLFLLYRETVKEIFCFAKEYIEKRGEQK